MLLVLIAIGSASLIFKYVLDKKFEDEFHKTVKKNIEEFYQGEVKNKNALTVAFDALQVYVSIFFWGRDFPCKLNKIL
jgi:hypothetical protein